MTDRLPLLGSDEHIAWCARADKGIRSTSNETFKGYAKSKPVKQRAKAGGLRRETVPRPVRERAIHLRLVEKHSPDKVLSMIYAEFDGYSLSRSAFKNFVWLHNKALREGLK